LPWWSEGCLGPGGRGRDAVLAAGLFFLCCALYAGTLGHGFCFDDIHSIARNPHIRTLDHLGQYFVDPSLFSVNPESAMYRPLLLVSYALNWSLTGAEPWSYHAVNVLLHGTNAALVFVLLLVLGVGRGTAALAALLFGTNPVNAEAVSYVSSRSELLMGALVLVACVLHVGSRIHGSRMQGVASIGMAAAALLAKSVAIVLPGLLLLLDWTSGGWTLVRARWKVYVPYVLVGAVYILHARHVVARAILTPVRGLAPQAWTQVKALPYYAGMGAMPVRLSAEHEFYLSRSPMEWPVFASILVVASVVLLVLRAQRARVLRLGVVWIGICMGPSLAVPLIVLVNEHRLYLATAGLALITAWCLTALLARRGAVALISSAVYTSVLVALALQRSEVWASELQIWQDAALKAPLMLRPHLRSADALVPEGRLQEAEAAYLRALALRPLHPATRNNLGRLYLSQGRLTEAEAQFEALLSASPDNIPARLNLGGLLLRRGEWQRARGVYSRALEFGDTGGQAQRHLGKISLRFADDPDAALGYIDAAMARVNDGQAELLGERGVALRALARYGEAETAYLEALRLEPLLVEAWYNLGNLYVQLVRPRDAEKAYERVVEIGTDKELSRLASAQLENLYP